MPAESSLVRVLDHSAIRAAVDAHERYLSGKPGGRRANLSYVDLTHCALSQANLCEAELTGARLGSAQLNGAQLDRAILYGADLRDADLRGASLIKADLRGACLRGANLTLANLTGCDLREGRTALQDSAGGFRMLKHEKRPGDLDYAILHGADLSGAQMASTSA